MLETWLSGLNVSQQRAILAEDGPLLVSAAAGTGKTRVLILRMAYLMQERGVAPASMMAVTFTNKAASEMRHRLQHQLNLDTHSLWVGTFHSLSLRMLRQHADTVGRTSTFTVLDTSDQQTLMQRLLKKLFPQKTQETPRNVLYTISQWKQKGWHPDDVSPLQGEPLFRRLYSAYRDEMRTMNAFDFDDLLLHSYGLLRDHPEILASYQQRFSYIFVDEYQDVNDIQHLWLKTLASKTRGFFCVGDDDQSIHGWRGANIKTMLGFEHEFPGAKIIYLEDNYRSSPHILSAASKLIAHNATRYGKVLRTDQETGEKIQIQGTWDPEEEAAFIAGQIQRLLQKGSTPSSMAVLMRTGSQTREFEERFMVQKIPYHLVGNTKFYERQEIRDVLGYLRLIYAPSDNLAFERILNTPRRSIGPTTLQRLHQVASDEGVPLEEAARRYVQTLPSGVLRSSLLSFLYYITLWREAADTISLKELAERVLQESGLGELLQTQSLANEGRMENVKELLKSMEGFSSLGEFLEHISLLLEISAGTAPESVALMTLHAAKGLEFDTVFLAGWEENVFPHIRAIEAGKKSIEEERRLAYVGLTRARKHCHISFCWNRRTFQGWMPSSPSRFIQEIPEADRILNLHMTRGPQNASTSASASFAARKPESSERPSSYLHPLPASPVASPMASAAMPRAFNARQRVTHRVFGTGVVESQQGDTVRVYFEMHGHKTIKATFLT